MMPAIRCPHTFQARRTPTRQTRRRKDEDKEAKALLDARVQRLKDCVVAFDALVNKRKELGGPLRLYLSCVIADRPLPVDGLSFVQHQKAFQGYFDAGMRRPFLFPHEFKSHTKYTVDKYKSDFAQEFPLDEPGSSFFSLARKRVQGLDWIQYQVDIYLANEMSMDIWEYTGIDFHHTVRIPFHPSDPRHRAMFDDRECTH